MAARRKTGRLGQKVQNVMVEWRRAALPDGLPLVFRGYRSRCYELGYGLAATAVCASAIICRGDFPIVG